MTKKQNAFEMTKNSKVVDILKAHPKAIDFFVSQGFKDLKNPVLRNTVARLVTIEIACSLRNKNREKFIRELKIFLGDTK